MLSALPVVLTLPRDHEATARMKAAPYSAKADTKGGDRYIVIQPATLVLSVLGQEGKMAQTIAALQQDSLTIVLTAGPDTETERYLDAIPVDVVVSAARRYLQ